MAQPQKTVHGKAVATVKMQGGKDYVTVAERSRFAHETFGEGDMFGYDIIAREFITLGDRYFMSVTIQIQGHTYVGTSEIRLNNAPPKSADEKAPMECAETSAVGRALGFAGIGVLDSIASADEIQRSNDQNRRAAPLAQEPASPTPRPAQPASPARPQMPAPHVAQPMATHEQLEALAKLANLLNHKVPENLTFHAAQELGRTWQAEKNAQQGGAK